MKKYLLILILIILTAPSIALASWWNPFSWNIFQRTDTKTEVLEKRIVELEDKLNNSITTNATSSKEIDVEASAVPTKATTTKKSPIKVIVKPAEKTRNLKVAVDSDSQAKPVNVQYLTKVEIAEFISRLKESIVATDKIQQDYDNRVTTEIQPEMAEYPSNQLLQQTGKDLINEFSNNIVLMRKVDVEVAKLINSMTPYLNSDASLTLDEATLLSQNLRYYNQQYDESQVKLKGLILSFLDTYSSALNNETARLRGLIDQSNQVNQTSYTNSTSNKQAQLNTVNQKIADLNAKFNQDMASLDTENAGRGIPSSVTSAQKAEIDRKYRSDYNVLQAEYQQIQYSN